MRRPLFILLLLTLLCACGNREKYERLLAEADSLNQNYIPFTTDSTMLDVVDYYEHHGTANERMRAYYLLGCVYRDLGEAPHALECYHDAVDCADTTSQDCDYKLLSRVYGQMEYIFNQQYVPNYQLEALEKAYQYAIIAKDTIPALIFLSKKADVYERTEKYDSVEYITKNIVSRFKELGQKQYAAQATGLLIYSELRKHDFVQAKRNMDFYEKESGFYDKGEVIAGKQIYYYFKGLYYIGTEQPDSAELFFRKLLNAGQDYNEIHAAYDGLFKLYTGKNIPDSLSKYAVLSTNYNDSLHSSLNTQNLQKTQAIYDYSRHQRLAEQAELKKTNAEKRNYILASSILLLLLLCYIIVIKIKKAKEREYNIMKRQLEDDIHLLENTKSEMESLMQKNSEEYASDIQEKSVLIQQLKAKIQESAEHQRRTHTVDIENQLMNSHIYRKFRAYADKPLKRPTLKDWSTLRSLVNREIPSFYAYLVLQHNIDISDFDMYILFRLRFHLSEISNLTGLKLSTISAKRKRLYFSIFQKDCSSDEFMDFLKNIG